MTCNCISELPEQIVEFHNQQNAYKTKPVLQAAFKDIVYPLNFETGEMTSALKTDVKLTVESRKSPKITTMTFTFCPFCGLAYNDDESVKRIPLTAFEFELAIGSIYLRRDAGVIDDEDESQELIKKLEGYLAQFRDGKPK